MVLIILNIRWSTTKHTTRIFDLFGGRKNDFVSIEEKLVNRKLKVVKKPDSKMFAKRFQNPNVVTLVCLVVAPIFCYHYSFSA